ncbi:MAG TPA: YaiO family outer membrane beta-barrel protein, partial [Pontibacter sp.]
MAFLCGILTRANAQSLTSEDYFLQARQTAFEAKDYAAAIKLCKQALHQTPDYTDAKVLLGRLYYWNAQPDSALVVLQQAVTQMPAYEDAVQALADILYFEKDYAASLNYTLQGLQYHPNSRPLLTRKATVLAGLTRYKEAYSLADSLLQTEPDNSQLRAFALQLKEYSFSNRLEVIYDYNYFNRQFSDSWHLATIGYSRQTAFGPVTGRISHANRYSQRGWQVEAEAYPKLSKTFYAYTSIGYSNDLPVFPKVRAGLSLFANLPHAWEAEGGIRYLNFDQAIWSYTLSAGKYFSNFWVNGRTYLSQGNGSVSQSYSFTTRYYLKGADNYVSFVAGWGISPDDRSRAVRLNTDTQ